MLPILQDTIKRVIDFQKCRKYGMNFCLNSVVIKKNAFGTSVCPFWYHIRLHRAQRSECW